MTSCVPADTGPANQIANVSMSTPPIAAVARV